MYRDIWELGMFQKMEVQYEWQRASEGKDGPVRGGWVTVMRVPSGWVIDGVFVPYAEKPEGYK